MQGKKNVTVTHPAAHTHTKNKLHRDITFMKTAEEIPDDPLNSHPELIALLQISVVILLSSLTYTLNSNYKITVIHFCGGSL